MKVGYIRVSTAEQNTARQEVIMEQLGVEKMYIDKMSGKTTDRPQLKNMLSFVRTGDTVIVESISRFARNTRDLLELVDTLTENGVEFVSKKESIDTTTPAGKFMLTVFAAVAELERSMKIGRGNIIRCWNAVSEEDYRNQMKHSFQVDFYDTKFTAYDKLYEMLMRDKNYCSDSGFLRIELAYNNIKKRNI